MIRTPIDARPADRRLSRRRSAVAGLAAIAGGVAWGLLAVAAELERRDVLTYDGYNRLLAIPLLLLTVAFLAARPVLAGWGRLAIAGSWIAASGMVLLLAGNLTEFWGVLFQDELNAYAAAQAGADDHWVGSDVGWIAFGIGMLGVLTGGVLIAIGLLSRRARPVWLAVFMALLGLGVLAGNLFGLGPAFASVPVLVGYGVGWVCFGRLLVGRGVVPADDPSTERAAA